MGRDTTPHNERHTTVFSSLSAIFSRGDEFNRDRDWEQFFSTCLYSDSGS